MKQELDDWINHKHPLITSALMMAAIVLAVYGAALLLSEINPYLPSY